MTIYNYNVDIVPGASARSRTKNLVGLTETVLRDTLLTIKNV